jgi:hypothetical protein
VAEDDWMSVVIPIPERIPPVLLAVILPSIFLRFGPALRSSALPRILIPKRKRLRPPTNLRISKIVIFVSKIQILYLF